MIIVIQFVLCAVLVLTLMALYVDERQKREARAPRGKVTHLWEGYERRYFIRVGANLPIKYSQPKKEKSRKNVSTKNISIGGVCMTTGEKFNVRDSLVLEIELPGVPTAIVARGQVAWVKECPVGAQDNGIRSFDMGIEFKELSGQGKEILFNFIKDSGVFQSEQT